jgi:hypothetical protein
MGQIAGGVFQIPLCRWGLLVANALARLRFLRHSQKNPGRNCQLLGCRLWTERQELHRRFAEACETTAFVDPPNIPCSLEPEALGVSTPCRIGIGLSQDLIQQVSLYLPAFAKPPCLGGDLSV